MEFLGFLNRNSGAFNVIFAMVVAIATVFYAVLTRRLVVETRRMREAQTEPLVLVRLEPSEAWINLITLIVENVGPGPAHEVRLSVTPDFEMRKGQHLSELGLFRYGIRHLAPGQRISVHLTSMVGQIEESQRPDTRFRFEITTTYSSSLGTSYRRVYPIDFLHLVGMRTIGTPPLQQMAKDLEKIREAIGHFASGFRKVQVDVFTASDRDAEMRGWEEERNANRDGAAETPQPHEIHGDTGGDDDSTRKSPV